MTRLGHADMTAVLDLVGTAHSFSTMPAFREGILPGLRELVPCDLVGYNEVDNRSGRSLVLLDEPERQLDDVEETLPRLAHQHPVIMRQAAGRHETVAISDFLTTRQFHRLELYDEIYKPLGAEDQIAFGLPGDVVVGIAFNRARRGFAARDRDVLEAIRPHMAAAFRATRARERAAALVTALKEGVERAGGAVVMLDRGNHIEHADAAARHLLAAYAGPGLPPAAVGEWLGGGPASASLELAGDRGTLTVSHSRSGDTAVLLLEERRAGPEPARLRSLGLTLREAEVLCLVAIGRTNDQIADALVISKGTVRKHLERVYGKLGVHSRTEAAARAHDVA